MTEAPLLDALGGVGRRYAGPDADVVPLPRADQRPAAGAVLVRCGAVVVKAHAPGTDRAALRVRLAAAAGTPLAEVLLAPLETEPIAVGGRLVSVWPYGRPVAVDPARVPWVEAATLLARLHTLTPPAGGLPACGAARRSADNVGALRDGGRAQAVVAAAWRTVPDWARGDAAPPGPLTVVHGDWHLGQLVARDGGWRLIDVDDLGVGPPVWDFARLAALRALGVVLEDEFRGFLDAYWAAGGPALRPGGGTAEDPAGWTALDAVTRAAVVSMAAKRAGAPAGGYPDALEGHLLRACAQIAACPT
ncbi:phosphotransferase family protein [Luedemannella helvata]|uniref:phosphotransferase family protein n=1 Tax=Luedemannella helvata TaxID=349315 RepID=UPI0031E170AF